MKKHLIYWLAVFAIVMVGCQKELSFEGSNTPAEGSLQSDVTGDCLPKTVNGTYVAATALVPATNTISVQVNVVKTGTYVITTDTINGYYFRAASTFTTLGATTVTLRGNGTPFAAGVNNFVVSFDSTFCDIQVSVLPAGAGGPAQFALVSGGVPPNCASAVVGGTYVLNSAVTASNYVDVTVNVTTIGTYTIRATGGNMTFQANGAFLATGQATVRLVASGTPNASGANTITFDAPFASCNFTVTVIGQAVFSAVCTSANVIGTYQATVAISPTTNTVVIDLNVATAGGYNISITNNGITFSGSGVLPTGLQTITLVGNGTPANQGTFPFTMPGTPSCTFDVVVIPAPVNPGILTCKINGVFRTFNVSAEASYFFPPPNNDIIISGFSDIAATEEFSLEIDRLNGANISIGTFTVNGLLSGFYSIAADYTDATPVHWTASTDFLGGTQNPAFTIIVTSVTATKIIGTFFGPIKENFGSGPGTKTITEGVFDVPIN